MWSKESDTTERLSLPFNPGHNCPYGSGSIRTLSGAGGSAAALQTLSAAVTYKGQLVGTCYSQGQRCCCCCVASVVSDSVRPHRRQPTRLPRPWDSPGKNTGVGGHFPLQCRKVTRESEVAQSCPMPCDPMDCSLPGSSVHGIFQARVLEWVAISFTTKGP